RLAQLRGALRVGAAHVNAAFVLHGWGAAFRADLGKTKVAFAAVAAVLFDSQHVRDDFSGLLDDDPVALLYAQPHEFVSIVEARAGNGGTGDLDGLEIGHGCQRAGFSDVDGDL